MAASHAYIEIWNETWQRLGGRRDVYDPVTKVWSKSAVTTWEHLSKNYWGDVASKTELLMEVVPFMAQVRIESPLLYATDLEILAEVIAAAGDRDWARMLLEALPWYLQKSDVVKNCCVAIGAMFSMLEPYLVVLENAQGLDSMVAQLSEIESEMDLKAGNLSLSERRDNIRRIRWMANENVMWSPKEVYYLPYLGKYSAINAKVEDNVIVDPLYFDEKIVQEKVKEWANVYGLEVRKA